MLTETLTIIKTICLHYITYFLSSRFSEEIKTAKLVGKTDS